MTLIVPAAGGFSVGSNVTSNEPKSSMNMSLDDVIAIRRKEAVKESRRGGGRARVSTADRSIAAGRAKRTAAVNSRRNLTPNNNKKATKMEIDQEVKTQQARAQKAQAMQEIRKAGGRVAATAGRARRSANKAAGGTIKNTPTPAAARNKKQQMRQVSTKQATVQLAQAKPPTKKAVNAAVQAFKDNGFQIPQGTQMVIRFEPPPGNNNANNNNANQGRGGGRGGGGGGGGGKKPSGGRGQGAPRNSNNNNNRNNSNGNSNNPGRRGGRGGRGGGRGGGGRN